MTGPLLIALFIVVALVIGAMLWYAKGIKWYNIAIFVVLFALWTAMFMFKNDGTNASGFSIWVWPVVACLYQLFQVFFRVPFGILSQKLGSRKQIVLIAGLANLLGMTVVVATNFSLASIVIATACTGIYGATFGLDSQYWSENHNIKKVFLSSAMIFTVPVIASLLAKIIHNYAGSTGNTDVRRIVLLVAIGLACVTIIAYSFMKERVETIGLDNMDPNSKPWKGKTYKDIFALSVAGAGAAFAYTFMTSLTKGIMGSGYSALIDVISLLASVITALFIIKRVRWVLIRNITLAMMFVATSVIGFAGVGGELSQALVVPFVALGSLAFGTYIMALFGSALHFDHKFPALVLGIWLTVKSGALALSILISGEVNSAITTSTSSHNMLVGVGVMVGVLVGLVVTGIASRYLFKLKDGKKQSINALIDHSIAFESSSSKVVVSNKIVEK